MNHYNNKTIKKPSKMDLTCKALHMVMLNNRDYELERLRTENAELHAKLDKVRELFSYGILSTSDICLNCFEDEAYQSCSICWKNECVYCHKNGITCENCADYLCSNCLNEEFLCPCGRCYGCCDDCTKNCSKK